METDYTVIEAVRQHFGDDPTGDIGVKGQDWHEWLGHQEVPFVGLAKDFPFGCPAVDRHPGQRRRRAGRPEPRRVGGGK